MSAPATLSTLQLRSSAGLYGADRMVLTLAQALCRRQVASRLLSINNYRMREQPLHDAARARGQDAVLLPCNGRFDPRTIRALASQLRPGGGQVLHAHDYKSAFYAWLATRHQPRPMVATLHGWVGGTTSMRLYNRVELAVLRRFDALVVVAAEQAERLHRAGIPRQRIHPVDNAIELPVQASDADVARRRHELGLDGAGFVFGAVARLSPEKNLGQLIEAFRPIVHARPDAHLLIVGDGPARGELDALCRQWSLTGRVRFAGNRDDMHAIYPLIDCVVLPSLSEGMPLVVLEAMSRGMPVVASAVGDVPRLLRHASHARLVPPGDGAALTRAMDAAFAVRGRHDAAAKAYVLAHHSPSVMADNYTTLYQQLLRDEHGRAAA
ncbi:glycosyltransferase [Lysobacter sp. F6437]|uniref:glycosyltransferase n=1 Tax=Lysobacter sp. F6437 TaxID=3459296 RepID=UPI00403D6E31